MVTPDGDANGVKVKGFGDGLKVTVPSNLSFDEMKPLLEEQFTRLKKLTENTRIHVETDLGIPDSELVSHMSHYLKSEFNTGDVTGVQEKKDTGFERARSRDVTRGWNNRGSDVLMMAGRIRSGQKISARKHLLIMGDVNPGGEVSAGGNIIVMGRLCGVAIAGYPDNNKAIVTALDFRPAQIHIGEFAAAGSPTQKNEKAEYAYVDSGTIVVDEYLKANPFGSLPWPEVL